jgi:O-antigen ligase|tara:strand:+ start:395 stop:1663 length:1269 start_codon:yes stop_codon:yes gene_type:complete
MIINNKKIIYFLSYLLLLIPLALITGPFLPDLFLVIIVVSFVMIMFAQKKIEILDNIYFKIYLIICLILSLNSFLSNNLSSLQSSIFYFRFGIFALFASYLINNNQNILKNLLYIFLIIYSFLFLDTLYQYFFHKNIFGFVHEYGSNFRITSIFGDDEVLGSYTARFFPLVLFLIIYNSSFNIFRMSWFLIIAITTVIAFTIVLLSGERTSLGLFILSFIFIFFSSINFRKIFLVPLITIILVFAFVVSTSEKVKNRVITQTINQMGLNAESERVILFSKTYEGHYLISYNMFKEKPLVGHGVKMFRFYCNKEENFVDDNACTTHPHNFYAQMLAETGTFGFIILMGIFISICYFFIKNLYFQIYKKKQLITDQAICLLSVYFMTLFPLLPSGNFFNNWLSIIMYYPLCFLIYTINSKKFYV